MKRIILFSALSATLFSSCKKDDVPEYNSNVKAPIAIEFDNVVGASDLQLGTGSYTNGTGETFTVSKLKYYVSNFVLTRTDGSVYTVPQEDSYFLINEADATSHEAELEIPEGEYKTLSFILGVDSLRSTMDISDRTGVLDPTLDGGDMYWGWNSGYIFFKMEGTSAASSMGGDYMYHIGLFGGYSTPTLNNIKKFTIDLSARGTAKVKTGRVPDVHLMVDLMKVFDGSSTLSIATHPMVMVDPYSANIAANYASMISHDHTHND